MESGLLVKGFLIDMDGLLLDTERVAEKCWEAAEAETGHRMPEGFYHTLIGQSMRACRQRLDEVMDPACDNDAFLAIASRHYYERLLSGEVPVKKGARGFLEYLAGREVPRCLATSTGADLCRRKLEAAELIRWLPERVCGDEVAHSKPAPDIYLQAAERIGLSPEDLLVIEDSENGLRAGLAAGCRVVHVPDLGPVRLEVQCQATRIYRDLEQLQAAMERGEIQVV